MIGYLALLLLTYLVGIGFGYLLFGMDGQAGGQ